MLSEGDYRRKVPCSQVIVYESTDDGVGRNLTMDEFDAYCTSLRCSHGEQVNSIQSAFVSMSPLESSIYIDAAL